MTIISLLLANINSIVAQTQTTNTFSFLVTKIALHKNKNRS